MCVYRLHPQIIATYCVRMRSNCAVGSAQSTGRNAVAVRRAAALRVVASRRQVLCVVAHGRFAVHVATATHAEAAVPLVSTR